MLPNLFPAEHYAARYNRQCASPASTKTSGKAVPKDTLDPQVYPASRNNPSLELPHHHREHLSNAHGCPSILGVRPKDVSMNSVVRGNALILYKAQVCKKVTGNNYRL